MSVSSRAMVAARVGGRSRVASARSLNVSCCSRYRLRVAAGLMVCLPIHAGRGRLASRRRHHGVVGRPPRQGSRPVGSRQGRAPEERSRCCIPAVGCNWPVIDLGRRPGDGVVSLQRGGYADPGCINVSEWIPAGDEDLGAKPKRWLADPDTRVRWLMKDATFNEPVGEPRYRKGDDAMLGLSALPHPSLRWICD